MKRSFLAQSSRRSAAMEALESRTFLSGTVLPVVTVSVTGAQALENSSQNGEFTLTRTGPTDADLLVKVSYSGTARSGKDCQVMSKIITIPLGSDSVTVPVVAIQDSLVEGTETVIMKLASSKTYTAGAVKTGTVGIVDDDNPTVTVKATKASAAETAKGKKDGLFTVSRNVATKEPLTVNFTVEGTATPDTDYVSIVSVVIPAGKKFVKIPVQIVNDAIVEGPETVVLKLTGGANQTVGDVATATVVISDNDGPSVGAGRILMPTAEYFPLEAGTISTYDGTVNGVDSTMTISVDEDSSGYRMRFGVSPDGLPEMSGSDLWFNATSQGLWLTQSDTFENIIQDGLPIPIDSPIPLDLVPGLLFMPVSVEGLQSYSTSSTRENGDASSAQVYWAGGEAVAVSNGTVDCIKIQININWNEGNGTTEGSGENFTFWLAKNIGIVKMVSVRSSWDGPSSQNPARTITNTSIFTLSSLPA